MISTSTDLIKKESIAEMLAHRDRAVQLYEQAIKLVIEANKSLQRAVPGAHSPIERDDFRWLGDVRQQDELTKSLTTRIDQSVWRHLLKASGLGSLMDRTAREAFEDQVEKNPPAATMDNVCATMLNKAAEADKIFERGLVESFRKLDRAYRTNDSFKVGKKIIMKGALTQTDSKFPKHRYWNHYARRDDDLFDIERTLHILDGKAPCDRYAGIISAINKAPQDGKTEAETEYFHVRLFANGNLHITFKRLDLVEKANRIIAKHNGSAIPSTKRRKAA